MQALFILLCCLTSYLCHAYSYPIFGTTRFQRAPQYQAAQYYNVPNVYNDPNLENAYYFPRHESGLFGLPTYEGEYNPTPVYYAQGPSYSYLDDKDSNMNPMDDLHEEIMQEEAMDRREFGPIGQEIWYESPSHTSDSLSRANAAFLNNLMLYQRQFGGPKIDVNKDFEDKSENSNYDYDYDDRMGDINWFDSLSHQKNDAVSVPLYKNYIDEINSDKEVKQLKELVDKHRRDHDTLYALNNKLHSNSNQQAEIEDEYDEWINWDKKRSTIPKKVFQEKTSNVDKPVLAKPSLKNVLKTTTTQKPMMKALTKAIDGQKEVVLPRPANPVRIPFRQLSFDEKQQKLQKPKQLITEPKKENNSQSNHSSGAIYDTIKHILRLEKNLDKSPKHVQQKRYVLNESALVQELNTLKRRAA
ncbi:uncharacterized protein LOC134830425 isoform X2 [Culicoides brevitarsis]